MLEKALALCSISTCACVYSVSNKYHGRLAYEHHTYEAADLKDKTAAVLAPVMEMDSSEGLLLLLTLLFSPSNLHNIIFYFYVTRQNNHPTPPLPLQTAHLANYLTHITMILSRSTLLHALAASAASLPFVAAQNQTQITTDQLYGTLVSTTAPAPGFNVDGTSVFTNFVNAFSEKQFFYLVTGNGTLHEKPGTEPVSVAILNWCSDIAFSDFSNRSLMGYASRCVGMWLAGYAEHKAAGDQLTDVNPEGDFGSTSGVSAVFVEQENIFECQLHSNTDGYIIRYWDDGRKTMPRLGWEGHDEGDKSANAATKARGLHSHKELGCLLKR